MEPTIFLSYCQKNWEQADSIEADLSRLFGIKVRRDVRDLGTFHNDIKAFMESVRDCDYVINLVSKEYLESENCMYEVIEFIKDTNKLLHFTDRTIPIILGNISSNDELNIFSVKGKLHWTRYWAAKHKELEIELKDFKKGNFTIDIKKATRELTNILERYKTIAESISNEFLTLMMTNKLCISFESLKKNDYKQIADKISSAMPFYNNEGIYRSRKLRIDKLYQERFKYISTVETIDREKPSFPLHDPKFPASETYKIDIDGFSNVWIKDESSNPTGTHKDRMALEVLRKLYYPMLKANIANENKKIPNISMISSGSAAIAIQKLLRPHKLPDLHVLTDVITSKDIVGYMEKIGCKVFKHDLSKKALKCDEILELTKNFDGIDISSREMLDPMSYIYYDWLSYEIINSQADYCFIPFGTGDLFHNVLNIHSKEYFSDLHDPRLETFETELKKTHYIGVTTTNSQSQCDKLYSPFLPFSPIKITQINAHKKNGVCGELTELKTIEEEFVDKALKIADRLNINCEASGIAGLGMLLQLSDKIDKDAKILIVNTGKLKMEE